MKLGEDAPAPRVKIRQNGSTFRCAAISFINFTWYNYVPDLRASFGILISERGKHKKPKRKQKIT